MKFLKFLIIIKLLNESVQAFSVAQNKHQNNRHVLKLSNYLAEEISSGKILEGGAVMDFENVKFTESKSEQALAAARLEFLKNNKKTYNGGRLMGINDEVVKEMGGEVGAWASGMEKEIQETAAYLRSKSSLFDNKKPSENVYKPELASKYKELLEMAYVESGEVTEVFAKTFFLGTQLMPEDAKKAIWAIYVWCRRTDEIVDAPREDNGDMTEQELLLAELSEWEVRLEELWEQGKVVDVLDLPLLDVRIKYPTLSISPFVDMIRGMLMDVPELGVSVYNKFDELHLYCYRVAGTVGLMSLPIFGCAPGVTEDVAREPALSLGVAFQLTNILRDVGEDATQRGRIYLPREDMAKFGVTEEQIYNQKVDENYINMMKYQLERARMYYARAQRGVYMLSPEARLPVQSSIDCYGQILDRIEQNGYDSLTKRAYLTKWEKLFEIPFSWYRTQDIARTFWLPGDEARMKLVDELEKQLSSHGSN